MKKLTAFFLFAILLCSTEALSIEKLRDPLNKLTDKFSGKPIRLGQSTLPTISITSADLGLIIYSFITQMTNEAILYDLNDCYYFGTLAATNITSGVSSIYTAFSSKKVSDILDGLYSLSKA